MKLLSAQLAVAGLAMASSLAAAHAATLTITPSQDAMIFGTSAGADTGNASGEGPALFAGADGSGNAKRSLVEFNVSSIPANATITNVSLTMTVAQIAGSGGGTGNTYSNQLGLYDLLQSWTTGTSGSPTSPTVGGTGQGYAVTANDATWTYATYNSNPALAVKWSNGLGGNFSSTESAETTATGSNGLGQTVSWTSASLIADVQGWVAGTAANDGWLLKSDNLESTRTSFLGFWSVDGAAANNNMALAPTLTITYTVGSAVPEPASLSLLAIGAPLLMRRRRRA